MLGHPGADGLHRHVFARQHAALDEQPADPGIGQAALGGISEAHERAVGEPYPAGSLDMNEKGICPVFKPNKLKTAVAERTFLDLAPGEIALWVPVNAPAIVKTKLQGGVVVETMKVVGPAIDRHGESAALLEAASYLGLEVTGEEALRTNRIVHLEGREILLEEDARLACRPSFSAHIQPIIAAAAEPHRPKKSSAFGNDLGTGAAEGDERLVMLPLAPAGNGAVVGLLENRFG
jgi:hypothetical protein